MIKTTLPNMQEKVHHRVTAGRKLAVTITHPPRFCNDLDICYRLETYNWLYFPWEKVLLFLPKIWIYNFIFLWKGTLQIISNLYSENPPFDPGRESCLPRVRKGWGAIFLGTVEPIRCALISFLGNLSEDKDKSLYITTMTLSSTTVLIITWELNVVFFFLRFFSIFPSCWRNLSADSPFWNRKNHLQSIRKNRLQSITVSLRSKILPQHHDSINTSHPFHPHHSSWPWLLAQINSYLCIMQWDLISIWMFNTIVMILLQLRMINVSLLVSKSICTKSKR